MAHSKSDHSGGVANREKGGDGRKLFAETRSHKRKKVRKKKVQAKAGEIKARGPRQQKPRKHQNPKDSGQVAYKEDVNGTRDR